MALPTNSFRPKRYFRSKFREGKYLLAAEATDVQLETHDLLREFIKLSYGNVAVQTSWKPDQTNSTHVVIRPGSAWDSGIPFLMKSGTDPKVIQGILPTGCTLADLSAALSDVGGKILTVNGSLPNANYAIVIEATEEVVRPTGSGAVDGYLQGVNVGEETANKARLIYKIHVVLASDLTETPTFPLSVDNHFVNQIVVTPDNGVENFLISSVPITQDVNGADIRLTLDNSAGNLPFSTDAQEYINGVFIDSDGNEMTITSITTDDAGATVKLLLDREVNYNASLPKSGIPVITDGMPYRLVKRDFYISSLSGTPVGRHYFKIATFTGATGTITNLADTRTVSGVNTFGYDPNARLIGGGVLSWDLGANQLMWDGDFEVTYPGTTAKAIIDADPSFTIASDFDVAFFYLDRDATADYHPTLISTPKDLLPPSVDVYVLAERRAGRIYFPHNGSIGDGETGYLGAFGGAFNKDLSEQLIINSVTENQMDEVFAETFNSQDNVDLANTVGMTYQPFQKEYLATAGSRFVDYEGTVVPDSGTLAANDLWTKIGTQVQAVAGGLLTLTDGSVGDRIAYSRTESSLTPLAHNEVSMRLRLTANGGQGGDYFRLFIKDGASGKHFGLGIKSTGVDLINGSNTVLQSATPNTATFHEYRLVKIGNSTVQWYIDGVLQGVYKWSDISTGSSGASTIEWGTTTPTTSTVDVDFVRFNIYLSILQSQDIFRQSSAFYGATAIPDSSSPLWTKVDGAGGITASIVAGNLHIVDGQASNQLNYTRTESTLVRQGDAEIEMRVKIASGSSSFSKFGVRMQDGKKDVAAFVRNDAGQLKLGLYDAASGTLRSTEWDIDADEYVVIKLRKVKDTGYQLFIDGLIKDSNSYEEFTDVTALKQFAFGSFINAANYTADIDYVQYTLPGVGLMAGSPVHDFLTIVNSNDPFPKVWISTDNGKSWFESLENEHTSITNYDLAGANIIARIMLSTVDSVLTDYGVLYNKTNFDVEGQFRYVKYVAAGAETVVNLGYTYQPGSNELEVFYRPFGTGLTRKLTLDEDYTEPNQSSIEINFALFAGDIIEARNIFSTDPIVPPPVRFVGHNHDGSMGENDDIKPTSVTVTDMTASRVAVTDSSKKLSSATTTITEVNLLAGKTSIKNMTNWGATAWTPTGTWIASTTYTGQYRRVGDMLQCRVYMALSGAPTAATLNINLPAAHTIDTAKMLSTNNGVAINGEVTMRDVSTSTWWAGLVTYVSTTAVEIDVLTLSNHTGTVNIRFSQASEINPFTFATGDWVSVYFEVPVVEYA